MKSKNLKIDALLPEAFSDLFEGDDAVLVGQLDGRLDVDQLVPLGHGAAEVVEPPHDEVAHLKLCYGILSPW